MPVAVNEIAVGVLSEFATKINGSPPPPELEIREISVESSLLLSDYCTIRVNDPSFHWLDSDLFQIGSKIIIEAGHEGEAKKEIFGGEVTGIEMDMTAIDDQILIVQCYDQSHRMQRGRATQTYANMTDADIIRKVSQASGLKANIEATGQVHEWVIQNNQTPWEFASERAAKAGKRLYVSGDTLHLAPVEEKKDEITLTWGENLRSFRPRISTSNHVDEVEVRGWDPVKKEAILGTSKKPAGKPGVDASDKSASQAKSKFSTQKRLVSDRPVHSVKEAEELAKSIHDDLAGQLVEADGLCDGTPEMKAGSSVKIENIGKKFSGTYHLTSVTHLYNAAEGYTTLFSINGKRPSTLTTLVDWKGGGEKNEEGGNIVVGIVTDNKDPKNMGRIKVKYPWLTEEHGSDWIRMTTLMGGGDRGYFYLPEINDEVLVAFEHGDMRRGYMIGALWNGKDATPMKSDKAVIDGKVQHRYLKTRVGHTMDFSDEDNKCLIALETKDKHLIEIRDDNGGEVGILIKDKHGNEFCISSKDDSILISCKGDMTLKSDKNIILQAQQKITMDAQTGIEQKTPMQWKTEAQAGVELKSPATVKIEGTAQAELKSATMLNLESSAMASLKAGAILNIQGTLVKIN